MPTWTRTLAGLALGGALTLSACGGGTDGSDGAAAGSASAATDAASGGAGQASPLPAVTVTDVASGAAVPLDSLLPADKPLLVWMWAPS